MVRSENLEDIVVKSAELQLQAASFHKRSLQLQSKRYLAPFAIISAIVLSIGLIYYLFGWKTIVFLVTVFGVGISTMIIESPKYLIVSSPLPTCSNCQGYGGHSIQCPQVAKNTSKSLQLDTIAATPIENVNAYFLPERKLPTIDDSQNEKLVMIDRNSDEQITFRNQYLASQLLKSEMVETTMSKTFQVNKEWKMANLIKFNKSNYETWLTSSQNSFQRNEIALVLDCFELTKSAQERQTIISNIAELELDSLKNLLIVAWHFEEQKLFNLSTGLFKRILQVNSKYLVFLV